MRADQEQVRKGMEYVEGRYGGKVSRGEEALFGGLAAPMRQLSVALAALEDAQAQVVEVMEASRQADSISAGQVNPPRVDVQGRGETTQWLVSVFESVNAQHVGVRELYRTLAHEVLGHELEHHRGLRITGDTAGATLG